MFSSSLFAAAAAAATALLPAVLNALAADAPAEMTQHHGGSWHSGNGGADMTQRHGVSGGNGGSGSRWGSGAAVTQNHGGSGANGGSGGNGGSRGSGGNGAEASQHHGGSGGSGGDGGGQNNGGGQGDGGGGGYTFFNWHQGGIQYQCKNGAGGSYTVTWSGTGDFVCGKGWKPGGPRTVHYSGTYHAKGGSYLALYGWMRNPLVEYYIVESYGDQATRPGTAKSSFSADGSVYTVYVSTQSNAPSIEGTATFQQYWSVRGAPRVGGTISADRHFAEWRKLGLRLGQYDYMIVVVEAFGGGGGVGAGSVSASITVS